MVLDTATPRHHLAKSTDAILAAADRAEPQIRRTILAALDELEAQLPNLSGLIASGDSAAVMREIAALQVPQLLRDKIVDATVNAAIQSAAPELAQFPVSFNDPNQRAIRWAELNAAKNIKAGSVSPATRGAIRDVVVNAIQQGIHPRRTARIVEGMVPLLPQHAESISRFVDGALDAGLDQGHIDKVVSRKTAKLRRYRAEMIARTEAIKSANMGQQLVWESAIDEGLLPAGVKKVWVATGDDRTCRICAVMDGQTVEVVGEFAVKEQATGFARDGAEFKVTGTKPLKRPASPKTPPAHPQCRCTVVLETIPVPGRKKPTKPVKPRRATSTRATRPVQGPPHMDHPDIPGYIKPRPTPHSLNAEDVRHFLDDDQITAINQGFARVEERWPGAVVEVQSMGPATATDALATKSRHQILFNESYATSDKIGDARRSWSSSYRTPLQVGADDVDDLGYLRNITTHEAGHVADGRLRAVASDDQRKRWDSIWTDYRADNTRRVADQKAGIFTDELPLTPSIYGTENQFEFIAECVLDVLTNDTPNPSSLRVGALLDEVFG